jgi:hypothetical protein
LSQTSSLFCSGYFEDRVSQTNCLGWPQTTIFPSASQVARIAGMSHEYLAEFDFFMCSGFTVDCLFVIVGWAGALFTFGAI